MTGPTWPHAGHPAAPPPDPYAELGGLFPGAPSHPAASPAGSPGPQVDFAIPGMGPPLAVATDAAGHPTRGPLAEEHRPPARRWSLRTRLMMLVLATIATVLGVVDIVLPTVVHNAMVGERDASLRTALGAVPPDLNDDYFDRSVQYNPLSSGIGWTLIRPGGVYRYNTPYSTSTSLPAIPQVLSGDPQTVHGEDGTGEYRVLAGQISEDSFLLVWTPLDDVEKTVNQLIVVELVITVVLLLVVGTLAGLMARRELKPLEEIASAAEAIAGGDLTRRVDPRAAGVEVERLRHTFNEMLDGLGDLLAERVANEARLRRFLADASHELRTPVAAVRGYTDLYRAGALPDRAAVDRAMDRMGFESQRMAALVEDLLTLTRADSEHDLPSEPVSLDELLTGVVEDAMVIDRSRTWNLVVAGKNHLVAGDRMRLHQVFANLLANVRTHTPEGTTTVVSLTGGEDDVQIEVIDDGPGVSPEDLPKIFDRFYRADPSRSREKGGSGLGLSIVAAIVNTHGGTVQAGRALSGGLAIKVTLPTWKRPETERPGRISAQA